MACNLSTPLEQLGARRSPGEYDFHPISAGIPEAHQELVHPVNFNDPGSVRYVCERHPVAALITEPILQNVGLIKPLPGYLEGLRELAGEFGFLLIFDEVKTGFRHAFGGYAELSGVSPDLAVYGKAIANGYPLAAIAGRSEWMDYFFHEDPAKRVLLAGTYNAHPVPHRRRSGDNSSSSREQGSHLRTLRKSWGSGRTGAGRSAVPSRNHRNDREAGLRVRDLFHGPRPHRLA